MKKYVKIVFVEKLGAHDMSGPLDFFTLVMWLLYQCQLHICSADIVIIGAVEAL